MQDIRCPHDEESHFMAIVFQEDFDGPNGSALSSGNTGFSAVQNPPIFSTAIKKAGTASARYTTTGSYSYVERTIAATTVRYWSFYIRPVSSPSANTVVFFVGASSASADRKFQVTLNTTRTVKMQQGSGAIIVGSATASTCPLNEWSRIDLSFSNGTITLALYPGNANCDKAAGTAMGGDTSSAVIANDAFDYMSLGVVNGTTSDFYIDEFREDTASLPGPLSVSGGLTPYLYYDTGSAWVDVTENLWYDNGTSWFQIEGDGISTGATQPANPRPIAGWGSSSMQGVGSGGSDVLSTLASTFSVAQNNYGYSGDWSLHTAAKMGAIPALVTIAGGTLPASGSVTVTISNIGNIGNNGTTLTGTLNSVPVSIVYSKTNTQYTLTRTTNGSALSVAANTPLVVNEGLLHRPDTNLIWTGKNDLTINANAAVQSVIDTTQACWDYIGPTIGQRLVMGHYLDPAQTSGNARSAILTVNSSYASSYGQQFIDVEGFLSSSAVWTKTGITPTASDLTAQTNRVLPPSLAYDTQHMNTAGYQAVAGLVVERLESLGWY